MPVANGLLVVEQVDRAFDEDGARHAFARDRERFGDRVRMRAVRDAHGQAAPAAQVAAFQAEMRKAQVDWQLVAYGGAVHSFTNPEAGDDAKKGAAYHALADRRSSAAMLAFFSEILK